MTPATRRLALCGLCIVSLPLLRAADDPETTEEKHVLYLGLDVSMSLEDTISPVVDADNVSVDIAVNQQRRRVPLRLGGEFRTAVVPRVGKSVVRIDRLQEERGFSRGNDPHREAAAQQLILTTAQSAREEVTGRAMRVALEQMDGINKAHGDTVRAAAGHPEWAVTTAYVDSTPELDQAMQEYDTTLGHDAGNSRTGGSGMTTHGDDAIYDALGISFVVSSQDPVANAYGVIRVFYRTPEKPDEQFSSIRFFGLPDLGPKPFKVYFHHEGLMPGYQLDYYEVHIYTNGRELATNLSKNRVELTLDEIHQFLILKYGTENPGGMAPAGIAVELLDHNLRELVPAEQTNRGVEVAINAEGRATRVTLENTGWSSADAYLIETLMQVRYLPALRNHKPVSDTGRFVLSEFFP